MTNYTVIRHNFRLLFITVLTILLMCTGISLQTREQTDVPVFSAESGFYQDAFYLEITAPKDCSIYYTLDCSTPDRNSILYTGPILIDDASRRDNVYSAILKTAAEDYAVQEPDFLVDKCTVVRAIAIPDNVLNFQNSKIITKSFFVGFSPDHFDNLNIISLVTDPDNLFSHEKGIYVTGRIQQEYLDDTAEEDREFWARWPANFTQRGQDWEREAHITYFDADGTVSLEKTIGIRIQGGYGRAYVPKSLNLFARKAYDGTDCFEYDFFGNNHLLSSLTLSSGGSGGLTSKMDDYLMAEFTQGMPYCVMSYIPCVMFLDGEYWGMYWLTEKYDSQYIQEYYNLSNTDIIIIKHRELEAGYEDDLLVYKQLMQFFEHNDMSVEANYAQACRLIDMDSFLDYYATMIYIARRQDWPETNEALWRTRKVSSEPYADGKWRWMLFDCNAFCMTADSVEHDTLDWAIQKSTIFRSLWNSPSFREAFQKRILQIADQHFETEKVNQFLSQYYETMVDPLSKNWARFSGSENNRKEEFVNILANRQKFFEQRRNIIVSWFE